MQLSTHFSLAELTVTKSGLPNVPNQQQILALEALCDNILEPVRSHFNKPVIVTSGFRSEAVNSATKPKPGARNSQHLRGEAADFHIPGVRNDDIWHYIKDSTLQFDQLIAETLSETNGNAGWIHCSYSIYQTRRSAISFIGKQQGYVPGLKYAS